MIINISSSSGGKGQQWEFVQVSTRSGVTTISGSGLVVSAGDAVEPTVTKVVTSENEMKTAKIYITYGVWEWNIIQSVVWTGKNYRYRETPQGSASVA